MGQNDKERVNDRDSQDDEERNNGEEKTDKRESFYILRVCIFFCVNGKKGVIKKTPIVFQK